MRGRDDHASANQRAINALYQARLRAVAECRGRLTPVPSTADQALPERVTMSDDQAWEWLNVGYLRAEWPPSMLN